MIYTINIEYTTGDSFHTENAEKTVELEWENVEIAIEAMNRIKEHNHWVEERNRSNRWSSKPPSRPSWHKIEDEEDDKEMLDFFINLPLDDGTEHQIHCFWTGYFENITALEVIPVKPVNQGMRIEL